MIGRVAARYTRWRDRRAAARAADAFYASATKPTILYLIDWPGWAHDNKAKALCRLLADEFDSLIVYESFARDIDIERADAVVVFCWKQVDAPRLAPRRPALRTHGNVAVGYTSHPLGDDLARSLAVIEDVADVSFVNSRLLLTELEDVVPRRVFEAPNGVDTSFYVPPADRSNDGPLRIGWAGSLTNHGDNRGYADVLKPAVDAVDGATMVTAAREDVWRTADEMRDWYGGIDVYACASRHEGTPNPCLEAAASGAPLVTTAVGNMPEFVVPGQNGIVVERTVESFTAAIERLVADRRRVREMGVAARATAVEWDWTNQAEAYRQMYRAMLADIAQRPSNA